MENMFSDLENNSKAETNMFADLKDEAKTDTNMFSDLAQKDADESLLRAATSGIKLVWKINAKAGMPVLKNAADFYQRTHSAVLAGVGNLTNAAQGLEDLQPIQAAIEGFKSDVPTPASVITDPIMDKIAGVLPTIAVPDPIQSSINAAIEGGTSLGLLEQGYNSINQMVHGGEIPSQPLDITPKLGAGVSPWLKKLPSQAAEVAVDLITDPVLNGLKLYPLIGKGVSAVAKVTGLQEVLANSVKNAIKILPKDTVDRLARFFTIRGGRDADFVNLLDKYYDADQRALAISNDISKSITESLTSTERTLLGNTIRELPKLTKQESLKAIKKTGFEGVGEELEKTKTAFNVADSIKEKAMIVRDMFVGLGAESVREGFMTSKTFMKHAGDFFPAFKTSREMEILSRKFGSVFNKTPAVKGKHFLQRKEMTWEEREAKGYIMDPAYPVARYLQQVSHDLNAQTLLKSISKNDSWVSSQVQEGFEYIPEAVTQKGSTLHQWGALAGKFLRKDIYDDLKVIVRIPSDFKKAYLTGMKMWKLSKVIPNPPTWINNIFGNILMTDVSGTANWFTMIPKLSRASKEMSGGRFLKEVQDAGAWHGDYLTVERNLVQNTLNPTIHSTLDLISNTPNHFLNVLSQSGIEAATGVWNGLNKFYTGQDNVFKMAHYIYAREKLGMEIPQAVEYMRKWGFDFSRVSPALQFVRNYTSPFATYTAKALPRIAEVILHNPAKLYKYPVLFDAFNRMSARVHGLDEAELQTINTTYHGKPLIMPWSDADGNPLVSNLQGMLPWGDMDTAGNGIGLPRAFSLSNPLFTISAQIISNRNFFTQDDILTDKNLNGTPRFSWENIEAISKLTYQTLFPSLAPGGAAMNEIIASLSPTEERRRSKSGMPKEAKLVLLGALGGIRMRGINIDKQMLYKSQALKRWVAERKSRVSGIAKNQSLTEKEKELAVNKEIDFLTKSLESEFFNK